MGDNKVLKKCPICKKHSTNVKFRDFSDKTSCNRCYNKEKSSVRDGFNREVFKSHPKYRGD